MPAVSISGRPPGWWLREIGLTGAAVVGALCLLAAVGSLAFGLQPLVFRSGSMSPAIETGALAVARRVPADSVRPGQVVSVTNAAGTRITHRVVEAGPGPGGTTELILRGDANAVPDAETYTATEVAVVLFSVPGLGYVAAALTHPVAIFLGGAVAGALLMYAFGRDRGEPGRPRREADDGEATGPAGSPSGAVVGGLVLLVGLGLAAAPPVPVTAAAFTDTATAASGGFSTLTRLPAPANFRCSTLGVLGLRFAWDAVSGATSYDLTTTPTSGQPVTTNHTGTVGDRLALGVQTGTAVVRARRDYPQTAWLSGASNARSYTVTVVAATCG